MAANSVSIDITADDQVEGELIARLVSASLNANGFEDVTNTSCHYSNEQEEEVVLAMWALNPEIFTYEITIEVSAFEDDGAEALAAADNEPGPGLEEFPDPLPGNDDDIPEDD